MEPGKILKVTIEYENLVYVAEGEDARSWAEHIVRVDLIARNQGHPSWNQWTWIEEKQS